MKKRMMKILGVVMLITMILHLNVKEVEADALRFTVQPGLPENQVDLNAGWFDLLIEPGESQTIQLNIINLSYEDIIIEPSFAPASTTFLGGIDYAPNDIEPDVTLVHNFADLVVDAPEYLVIPGSGSEILEVTLQLPSGEFEGLVAGGVTIEEREPEFNMAENEQLGENQAGMALDNRFRMTVAVILRNNLEPVDTDMDLIRAAAGSLNARNVINAYVQNPQPSFLGDVTLWATVTDRTSGAVMFQEFSQPSSINFAPNTLLAFPIRLDGILLEAGLYTMNVRAETEDDEWELTYDFEITQEEADRLNAADVLIEDEEFPWLWVLIGATILLVVMLIFLVVLLKRKRALRNEYEDAYEEYDEYDDYDEYEDEV